MWSPMSKYMLSSTLEPGKLYKCTDESGENVLIKRSTFQKHKEGVPVSWIRSISFLKEVDHPNILRLLEVQNIGEHILYQVFEFIGRDLGSFIPRTAANRRLRKIFLHQILTAVSFLHSNNVIHGCLAPCNVLVHEDGEKNYTLKLAKIKEKFTPSYKAPEILLGTGIHSSPVDMWSVGCIFAEMVNHRPLFTGEAEFHEILSIFRVMGTPTEETWPGLVPSFNMAVLTRCEPKDLATIVRNIEPAGIDLLKRMLSVNPNGRITAEAALKHEYFFNDEMS